MLYKINEYNLKYYILKKINHIKYLVGTNTKKDYIKDIFSYYYILRSPKKGYGNKKLSYLYFLELYNYFPEICHDLVSSDIIVDIGYFKDLYNIWRIILDMNLDENVIYSKYNKLIEVIKNQIIEQRNKDIKYLDKILYPNLLENIDESYLKILLKNTKINISLVGKYCIREKSTINHELYWFYKESNTIKKLNHIDYLLFKNNHIELKGKKKYRQINSKLYYIIKNFKNNYRKKINIKDICNLIDNYNNFFVKKYD